MGQHSRRQNTTNTRGDADMPTTRTYPQDGIPVKGWPGVWRYRSGKHGYVVTRTGAIERYGHLAPGAKAQ